AAEARPAGPGAQDDHVHSPSLLMFSSASRWVVRLPPLQATQRASSSLPALLPRSSLHLKVSAPADCGNSLSPGVVAPIMCATECSNSHPGLWRCSMAVTALEIKTCSPFAQGKTFGDVGPYQQLDGTVHFA